MKNPRQVGEFPNTERKIRGYVSRWANTRAGMRRSWVKGERGWKGRKDGTGMRRARGHCELGIQVSTTRSYFLNKHTSVAAAVPFGNGFISRIRISARTNCRASEGRIVVVPAGLFVCLR